jgi:hypothetical protein|tara:strand:- start:114 stop:884 length:771 start_codon:yes stop_codon:yes gene_type:complete
MAKNLTKTDFIKVLTDPKINSEKAVEIFRVCYGFEYHRGTPTGIMKRFNKKFQAFQGATRSLAVQMHKQGFDIERTDKEDNTKYVGIFFNFHGKSGGENKNLYIVEVKQPIINAMEELGLLDGIDNESFIEERNVLIEETEFPDNNIEAEEGKKLLKKHYVRERNPKIINNAKKLYLKRCGELVCEVCGFSFEKVYGDRVKNYIEGHHKKAISEMKPGDTTKAEDIAMLCSNCHRTIHAKWPYISVQELKNIIKKK